ncbi:MAG: hypothetical protein R3A10_02280 [Caldilineaceae bacterium]
MTVADSTSVNLYKLALAAVRARPGRHKIVTDDLNFPSDVYILQGICDLLGPDYRLEIVPSPDGIHGAGGRSGRGRGRRHRAGHPVAHGLQERVHLRHGRATALACQSALTLWDLSHSAGAVDVDLNGASRSGRGLHVQVPERRPGRAGVPLRAPRL